MARLCGFALAALAVCGMMAGTALAGNISTVPVDETAPAPAIAANAAQTAQAQLSTKGINGDEATKAVNALTADEVQQVADHPQQVQVAQGLEWYWWVLIAVGIGALVWWLCTK